MSQVYIFQDIYKLIGTIDQNRSRQNQVDQRRARSEQIKANENKQHIVQEKTNSHEIKSSIQQARNIRDDSPNEKKQTGYKHMINLPATIAHHSACNALLPTHAHDSKHPPQLTSNESREQRQDTRSHYQELNSPHRTKYCSTNLNSQRRIQMARTFLVR